MNSSEIRKEFINFFKNKNHKYIRPSYLVNKNDPTLMFTNAGMNQFKNIFLGKEDIKEKCIVNSQPCLRISGKHNDLDEVGVDMYHHTLFEMLGNWSMNDYFKEEAIAYAWELLTDVFKLKKEDLYVTVFAGDKDDGLEQDIETYNIWSHFVSEDHILFCGKKDNFWEMEKIGPCGPSTEIHIDLRDNCEKKNVPGYKLVNTGHKDVIEIWNIVFIQFNRVQDKKLLLLPKKFVDTGMGFERLVMVLQNKKSTYDTDIFKEYMDEISKLSVYYEYTGSDSTSDIAFRVISDHIRTIVMALVEGLLPSNVKEGYVIRMVLRRAQRYGYSFLCFRTPFLYKLVDCVYKQFKDIIETYESPKSVEYIQEVIKKEEESFLKVIADGHNKLVKIIAENLAKDQLIISGEEIFKLKDTYGFPVEMAELMIEENKMTFDKTTYSKLLLKQKKKNI